MNRREFTKSLGALAASPVLPMKALAAGAASVRPLHQYQHPYCWAAFLARVHNRASPAMFQRHFNLSPEMAQHVMGVLEAEEVIVSGGLGKPYSVVTPFHRSQQALASFKVQITQPDAAPNVDAAETTQPDSPTVNQRLQVSEDDSESNEHPEDSAAGDGETEDRLVEADTVEACGPGDLREVDC